MTREELVALFTKQNDKLKSTAIPMSTIASSKYNNQTWYNMYNSLRDQVTAGNLVASARFDAVTAILESITSREGITAQQSADLALNTTYREVGHVPVGNIVDDTVGGTDKVLSGASGKVLRDELNSAKTELTSTTGKADTNNTNITNLTNAVANLSLDGVTDTATRFALTAIDRSKLNSLEGRLNASNTEFTADKVSTHIGTQMYSEANLAKLGTDLADTDVIVQTAQADSMTLLPLTTAPVVTREGMMYYNLTEKKLKMYINGSWANINA